MTKFLKQFFVNISQKALFVTESSLFHTEISEITEFLSACSAVILIIFPQKSQKWQKWGYAPCHADCNHLRDIISENSISAISAISAGLLKLQPSRLYP